MFVFDIYFFQYNNFIATVFFGEKKMKRSISLRVFLLVFFFSFLIIVPLLNAQKIKIETEKGTPVVNNPKKPAPPPGVKSKLILEEELCIGDDAEEYLFAEESAYVSTAVDNEGNIYTVDPKLAEVRKFSPKGKLLKLFGKKGQGPEEMLFPGNIRVTAQNELMFTDRGNSRITFYSLNGEFLRYIPTYKYRLGRTKIDSNGKVVAVLYTYSEKKAIYEIKRFNNQLEPEFTIVSIDVTDERKGGRAYSPVLYWQITKEDNIIVGYPKKYEFYIFNPEGKVIRKITKEYDAVKVPDELEEKEWGRYSKEQREKMNIVKYHHGFFYFTVDEEGRIFARTWEQTKDKRGYFYDVFDAEGRYIAKIPIKAFVKLWIKGKLYTAEETEDGFPVIKRYNVKWEL